MSNIVLRRVSLQSKEENISFGDSLVAYFKPFWDAHSLDEDWLSKNTSHYMTEQKPFFQGLVIVDNKETIRPIKSSLNRFLWEKSMRMNMRHLLGDDGMMNRAGQFTFITIDTNKTLENFMRNKKFDMIIVAGEIEVTEDFYNTMVPHLKNEDYNRIILFI